MFWGNWDVKLILPCFSVKINWFFIILEKLLICADFIKFCLNKKLEHKSCIGNSFKNFAKLPFSFRLNRYENRTSNFHSWENFPWKVNSSSIYSLSYKKKINAPRTFQWTHRGIFPKNHSKVPPERTCVLVSICWIHSQIFFIEHISRNSAKWKEVEQTLFSYFLTIFFFCFFISSFVFFPAIFPVFLYSVGKKNSFGSALPFVRIVCGFERLFVGFWLIIVITNCLGFPLDSRKS